MSPAEAARKTKEFRCPPKEQVRCEGNTPRRESTSQMIRLMDCKIPIDPNLTEEQLTELDPCPMSDSLQVALREFTAKLVR